MNYKAYAAAIAACDPLSREAIKNQGLDRLAGYELQAWPAKPLTLGQRQGRLETRRQRAKARQRGKVK